MIKKGEKLILNYDNKNYNFNYIFTPSLKLRIPSLDDDRIKEDKNLIKNITNFYPDY